MRTLVVRGLRKDFPREQALWKALRHPFRHERVEALRGVDLDLEAGRIYGLIGKNGAGKTTLLKLLGGLVEPSSGSIRLDGTELAGKSARLRQSVRMVVADERSFFWRLSVAENLRFFATMEGLHGAARERAIEHALAAVSLQERADSSFRGLSTGMRQRLAVARGLLGDPQVLLLDEATRSLDPGSAEEVRELLRGIARAGGGRTLVWSSHDLAEVEGLCSDVILLRDGQLVGSHALEAPERARRFRLCTRQPLSASSLPELAGLRLLRVAGAECVVELGRSQDLGALLRALSGRGLELIALQPLQLDPEAIFGEEQASA